MGESVSFVGLLVLLLGNHVQGFAAVGNVALVQRASSKQTALSALPDVSALSGGEGGYSPEVIGAGVLGVLALAAFSMNQSEGGGGGGKSGDVSIPYDAAARLAYDEFKSDGDRKTTFEEFNEIYKEKTVAEVTAKKKARDLKDLE